MKIEYCAEGKAITEWNFQEWIDEVARLQDTNELMKVSTELAIDMVRSAILDEKINPNNIQFLFNGIEANVNEYGVIIDWPKGLADFSNRVIINIVEKQCARRKAYKEKLKEERGWKK
jgi:hypothetical protein